MFDADGQKPDLGDILDMRDKEKENHLPHSELTRSILGCCFEVMKELGPGFQERVYKNALFYHAYQAYPLDHVFLVFATKF